MDTREFSVGELIDIAYNTADHKVFKSLAAFENMFVRRAVARNTNTPREVIDRLAHDPVQNVSYMALKHRNCSINREIKGDLHECVICSKDERTMDCSRCNL